MRQLVYQDCYTRYHVSSYLWLIGSVLKDCKVPKILTKVVGKKNFFSDIVTALHIPTIQLFSCSFSLKKYYFGGFLGISLLASALYCYFGLYLCLTCSSIPAVFSLISGSLLFRPEGALVFRTTATAFFVFRLFSCR